MRQFYLRAAADFDDGLRFPNWLWKGKSSFLCGILSSFNVSASSCKRCTHPRPALMWDATRLLHADLVPAVIQNFQPFSVLCAPHAATLRSSVLPLFVPLFASLHQIPVFQLPSFFTSPSLSPQGLPAILYAREWLKKSGFLNLK